MGLLCTWSEQYLRSHSGMASCFFTLNSDTVNLDTVIGILESLLHCIVIGWPDCPLFFPRPILCSVARRHHWLFAEFPGVLSRFLQQIQRGEYVNFDSLYL